MKTVFSPNTLLQYGANIVGLSGSFCCYDKSDVINKISYITLSMCHTVLVEDKYFLAAPVTLIQNDEIINVAK